MRIRSYIPHLITLGMLVTAAVAIRHAPDMSMIDAPAVATSLPDRVGEWVGEELSYCQNETCMKAIPLSQLSGATRCPDCGGEMVTSWSLAERRILPADTVLVRKLYRCASRPALLVSIVISSSEEVSIHRPQLCLTGQGYDIAGEQTREIPLRGRQPLHIRVMNLFHRQQTAQGKMVESPSFYAYWFAAQGHETPSSAWRVFYAARDRIIFGRVLRWAYVSIAGERTVGSPTADRQLQSFVRDFHPQIIARVDK